MLKFDVKPATAVGALAFASIFIAMPANAVQIAGLFNTGLYDSGAPLPLGSIDPHYTVLGTGSNAEVITDVRGNYLPNGNDSLWIWENSNGQPTNVTRTFRTTFDLTGFDVNTASISGLWGTDNFGEDILINGVSTGQTIPTWGFGSLTPFSITSGFVQGLNTIDFVVRDTGVVSAFRVDDISGTAEPVPESSSLISLFGLGLAALAVSRKSMRR